MELNRRHFLKLLGIAPALPAPFAKLMEKLEPVRLFAAVKVEAYPGPTKPHVADTIKKPSRWAG